MQSPERQRSGCASRRYFLHVRDLHSRRRESTFFSVAADPSFPPRTPLGPIPSFVRRARPSRLLRVTRIRGPRNVGPHFASFPPDSEIRRTVLLSSSLVERVHVQHVGGTLNRDAFDTTSISVFIFSPSLTRGTSRN